jgi:uncharacterized protein (TIGR02453 family)
MSSFFTPKFFKFLKDLKKNNNREWFQENKNRFEEEVKQPMLHFITELKPEFQKISPKLSVDPKPVGGSMFRIYRDVRFSADKSPYKTHMGAHFPIKKSPIKKNSKSKDVHTPGYYLHLSPGECFVGSGIWKPDAISLTAIRQKIVTQPKVWEKIRKSKLPMEGDALKNPPRGYDPEHPFIDDLKRKDFITSLSFTEKEVCDKNFMKQFSGHCKKMEPLVAFLAEALKIPW